MALDDKSKCLIGKTVYQLDAPSTAVKVFPEIELLPHQAFSLDSDSSLGASPVRHYVFHFYPVVHLIVVLLAQLVDQRC